MRTVGVRAPRTPWTAAPPPDDDPDTSRAAGVRKKGAWVRAWLKIDSSGQAEVVEAGKHSIMRRAGLPARDLRILDPLLSYPSTVLGRERAIVVNLEHIKAIITSEEVLLLNYRDPNVEPFVDELRRRLTHRHNRLQGRAEDQKAEGTGGNADWENVYDLEEPRSRTSSRDYDNYSVELQGNLEADDNGRGSAGSNLINSDMPKFLPFEFVALETCLQAACSCLETEVRDELEHLLDDDDDMAEMYLTDKLIQQNLSKRSYSHSLNEQDDDLEEEGLNAEVPLEETDIHDDIQDEGHNIDNRYRILSGSNLLGGDSPGTHTCSSRSGSKHLDVEELEMLLEAYFVQIDSTLNKLSTLREYVDDTEDYINIMLDDKQNQLLQVGVVLTTATLVVSAFVSLVGIFGMNINIDLFGKKGMYEWSWTVGGGATGCVFLYIMSIAWCKRRRLLE